MTEFVSRDWAVKHAAKALLGYILDGWLFQHASDPRLVFVPNVWDIWWACYRADLPLRRTGVRAHAAETGCRDCAGLAIALAESNPVRHPDSASFSCGCLLRWAKQVRSPDGPKPNWPPSALALAIIKPGAPAETARGLLAPWFEVLKAGHLPLTVPDLRRLYPEAYGADYVAERDVYMTSAPVHVLTLFARNPHVNTKAIKDSIRDRLGGDSLRNGVHMSDNPAEALADIAQFSGYTELAALYRRYERDHAPARLAFYRSALGVGDSRSHRNAGLPGAW